MIPLSDTVYIIDADTLTDSALDDYSMSAVDIYKVMGDGIRLDNEYWDEILDTMEAY